MYAAEHDTQRGLDAESSSKACAFVKDIAATVAVLVYLLLPSLIVVGVFAALLLIEP